MRRRGFTIIELIIVLAIMGILLVLGVVNLRGSQATARDGERKADVEAIALANESFYNVGNFEDGRDPGTYMSSTTGGGTNSGILQVLRDIDPKSLVAPGKELTFLSFKPASCSGVCLQTTSGVTPTPSTDDYIYQPIRSDGALCTTVSQGCRKFNIYYRLEVSTTECPGPNNICKVTSKNQ